MSVIDKKVQRFHSLQIGESCQQPSPMHNSSKFDKNLVTGGLSNLWDTHYIKYIVMWSGNVEAKPNDISIYSPMLSLPRVLQIWVDDQDDYWIQVVAMV